MKRRDFFRHLGLAAGGAVLWGGEAFAAADVWPYAPYKKTRVVVCQGNKHRALLALAFDKLGGLARFVPAGAKVLVKPNIGWDRAPEYAANTNPAVVAAVVELVRAAGASRVKVYDNPCDDPRRTYAHSGIADAARDAGAHVEYVDEASSRRLNIPNGVAVTSAEVYADVLDADVIVNVPVAKDHGLARLTLGMKNLMGLLTENRGRWHNRLGHKLVDLAYALKPALTIVDATHVMLENGPSGGELTYVKRLDKLVVTSDITAADAYAATLFGLQPQDISVVKAARERNLGTADLERMEIVAVTA